MKETINQNEYQQWIKQYNKINEKELEEMYFDYKQKKETFKSFIQELMEE